VEGDRKTHVAPPCRDNNGKDTQKTTSVREQVGKKRRKIFALLPFLLL
jgi:hypothetical protein